MVDWLNNAKEWAADAAEDVALSIAPSETVSNFLNSLVEQQPEHQDIVDIITADEELTAAIANLRLNNPETLDKIMEDLTGGENASPEALEAVEAALSNDVLRGQLIQAINNVANDPNITDVHVTNLIDASENYKTTLEGMGLTGVFGAATGFMSKENQAKLDGATQELTQAYVDLGMTEEDAKLAIAEGWEIGVNQAIDGLDNFGSHISGFVNSLMFNLGPIFDMLGLNGLLEQFGFDRLEGGVADLFGEEVASTIESYVTPATDWAEANMNLNFADNYLPDVNSLPEFVTNNITSGLEGFEAVVDGTTAQTFEDHFSPDALVTAPGVTLSFGSVNSPVMSPEDIAQQQQLSLTQGSGSQLSYGLTGS